VLLQEISLWGHHLEGYEVVTPILEALDDATNKVALDAIWLDHNVSALLVAFHFWSIWIRRLGISTALAWDKGLHSLRALGPVWTLNTTLEEFS